jgi:hypothetical protein
MRKMMLACALWGCSADAVQTLMDLAVPAGADLALPPGADLALPPGADLSQGSCLGSPLLASLGRTHLLAGASMEDASAAAAPFDLRYIYISGQFPDQGDPCASCLNNCSTTDMSGTHQCTNAAGCNWWGCWQYDQDPPGEYVPTFAAGAAKNNQIPMYTWYVILQASGVNEGAPEVGATNDATFLTHYFNHWRFFLQHVGNTAAVLHIEPDFWGYAEMVNANPHMTPSKVTTANPTDCASQENSIAGFAKCMIAMVRKYAPNAKVGLHASAWGTSMDVLANTQASFDVAGEAQKLATFLVAAGAQDGDFLVVDASDRDAGYYQYVKGDGGAHFWDTTNAKLPDFHQAFAWAKEVAEAANLPVLWWQLPVGNSAQNNTCDHYQDNRVDYFFAHTDEVAAAHAVGFAFGAGADCNTTPESDGGNLIMKTQAYGQKNGQPLCP